MNDYMIRDGKLFIKREVLSMDVLRGRDEIPPDFEFVEYEVLSDKSIGWVPAATIRHILEMNKGE
jgi:hypothetical protein